MSTLILICIIIAVMAAVGAVVVRLKDWVTGPERKAALAVVEQVLLFTDEEQKRTGVLARELDAIVAICQGELDQICDGFRREIPSRVARVIDKDFFHNAVKSRFGRKRKELFEKEGMDAIKYVVQAEQLTSQVNGALRNTESALKHKVADFEKRAPTDRRISELSDEVVVGLARLLTDSRRIHRFLGHNPVLHSVARYLLANASPPKWGYRDVFHKYGLSPREWLAALQFPSDIFKRAQADLNQTDNVDVSLRQFFIESVVLVGIADALYHLTHDSLDGIIRMAFHVLPVGFFFEVIWDWLTQWILEHFGQEVLHEVLTLIGDLATGLIIVTWVWRGWRYARLVKKVKLFWSGEEVLPILRTKFQSLSSEVLNRVAQQPIEQSEFQIKNFIEAMDRKINEIRSEAVARRALLIGN